VLRFRLGPFPVTVHLSFLIVAALLGYYWTGGSMLAFAIWMVVVFVSVLVHELGHAVVARAFGGRPEIALEGFGGVTFPRCQQRLSAGKQIALSLAGPLAGLGLGATAWLLGRVLPPEPGSPTYVVLSLFEWTSVVWAVLNLLPVIPLDGGHVLQALIEGVRRKPSAELASWISAGVAAAVAVLSVVVRTDWYLAIWFTLFALQNVSRARLARQEAAAPPAPGPQLATAERDDVERELARARTALLSSDVDTALSAAALLEGGEGPYRQAAGLRIRAGVELARGDNLAAGLHAGRSYTLWQSPDAAVVAARANLRAGERDRALNWLKRAIEAGAPPAAVREDPELGPLTR
jgi:stage IV sporulation protein FB